MLVDLSSDKAEMEWIARDRHDRYRELNVKTKLKHIKQTYETSLYTVASEFGCARGLGVEPVITRQFGPDPGYDVLYVSAEIEVKYTPIGYGRLVYNPELHKFRQDIWVLAIVPPDEWWSVTMAGWIWRGWMEEVWFKCKDRIKKWKDDEAWCIDQRDLMPFEGLFNGR